jgi:hypothetical protein
MYVLGRKRDVSLFIGTRILILKTEHGRNPGRQIGVRVVIRRN